MYKRTKSQSAPEGGGHVGDGHVFVALAVDPTPLLQSLDGSHPPGATDEVDSENNTLRTLVVGGLFPARRSRRRSRTTKQSAPAQGLTVNCGRCSCVRFPSLTWVNRTAGSPGRAGAAFQRTGVLIDKRARVSSLTHDSRRSGTRGGGRMVFCFVFI